jgi:hypothetical protein
MSKIKDTNYSINIFEVFKNINTHNITFFDTLTDKEQKAFAPYAIQRWLISTPNLSQLMLLNEIPNKYLNSQLSKHPSLIYKLLLVCGIGKTPQYQYTPPKTKSSKSSLIIQVIKEYYQVSSKKAEDYATLLSIDDVKDLAHLLGYAASDISKIK